MKSFATLVAITGFFAMAASATDVPEIAPASTSALAPAYTLVPLQYTADWGLDPVCHWEIVCRGPCPMGGFCSEGALYPVDPICYDYCVCQQVCYGK